MKGFIAVAAGIVTILGFFGLRTVYDLFPHKTDSSDQVPAPSYPVVNQSPEPATSVPSGSTVPAGSEGEARPVEQVHPRVPGTPPPSTSGPEYPFEFTLGDGEQQVLLSGQAAVSAQFNQLGEESFLTLRISIGGETTSHVVLAPGARFTLPVQEAQYYLSLLNLDLSGRTARIRIDRAR